MSLALDILYELRELTATPGRGCTRLAYTHLEDEAHDRIWDRFSGSGLARLQDAAGNTFILPPEAASGEPVILVGSHLDTVKEGGWLDGALGVAVGAEVLQKLERVSGNRTSVGLVIFRDEEGARFGRGLFGSKVFAGRCTEEDLEARDEEGVFLRQVVPDPEGCLRYRRPVNAVAYLECHIEQGRRLLDGGFRIGMVTGIVGIRRLEVRAVGAANHAGTTEMHRRLDALVPVATLVGKLPRLVQGRGDAVITCGKIAVEPGVANIVPGLASAVVEIRAPDSRTLDAIEDELRRTAAMLEPPTPQTRMPPLTLNRLVDIEPTSTDRSLLRLLEGILDELGVEGLHLSSMAGHDAQHAALVCPSAMFFIPSLDGVSHSPEEDSRTEDIELAAEVMLRWVERCSRFRGSAA
ncbi:N-carbamoyl-L-amino acid hydrolase [bacterium HR33]|nr:N-carbamoyl-L-amino acid hydrolase [bacterium HR33]